MMLRVLSLMLVAVVVAAYTPFNYGPQVPGMKWFTEAKLGMFMHWGPISQWGTEISFPLVCDSFPCTVPQVNHTPHVVHNEDELRAHRQAYANLMHTFNPVQFDPDHMALLAKQAGFKYMVYTTIHCDGFVNWNTKLTDYNIMNTPFARDVYGELVAAFRRQGLRVGAYICPSFWNNNSYWYPDALTALGPVCAPNYAPDAHPERWQTFTSYLLGLVSELAEQYAPDLFWFDCYNSPPGADTMTDEMLALIRSKNPEAVVMTRNGEYADYFETDDQSEHLVASILGQQQMSAGYPFEIPSVLQSSRQWAYDPFSGQKPAAEILANQLLLNAKGGNYLINVAPNPLGVWADGAVTVLQQLADWYAVNGEALEGTAPVYPYQYDNALLLSKDSVLYVIYPSMTPGQQQATPVAFPADSDDNVTLPWIRPTLLADRIASVEVLGAGPVPYELKETGLTIQHSPAVSTVNLRSYYSADNKDTAPCALRSDSTCSIYTDDGYVLVRAEGTCYATQQPGTVALPLIFSADVMDNALSNSSWVPAGYSVIDTECFGYPTQQPGTIPVDAYYNGKDFWMLASDASRAEAQARGYVMQGTVAHILPLQNSSSLATVFKITFQPGRGAV